jgi:hypothetical protein
MKIPITNCSTFCSGNKWMVNGNQVCFRNISPEWFVSDIQFNPFPFRYWLARIVLDTWCFIEYYMLSMSNSSSSPSAQSPQEESIVEPILHIAQFHRHIANGSKLNSHSSISHFRQIHTDTFNPFTVTPCSMQHAVPYVSSMTALSVWLGLLHNFFMV